MDQQLLLLVAAAVAYLDRLRKLLQARVRGDKGDQVEQESADWIHDDVAIPPAEIPLIMDKGRVACETTFYTQSGKTLATLNDSGARSTWSTRRNSGRGSRASTTSSTAATRPCCMVSALLRSTSGASSSC